MLNKVIEKISEQQKGFKNAPAFYVGEHLKDILKRCSEACCEIVLQDLDVKEMSISHCEKKIKEYADKHKKGNVAFVPPNIAEDIICKFYGIEVGSSEQATVQPAKEADSYIDLSDFI